MIHTDEPNGWRRAQKVAGTLAAMLAIIASVNAPLWWIIETRIDAKIEAAVPERIWTVEMMEAMRLQYTIDNPGAKVRSAPAIYRKFEQ